jgi:protein-S-isoprenylcysteine O-methyltransferase Ste14
MTPSAKARITGWAAVAIQFVALAGIVLSPGDPTAVPPWVSWSGIALMILGGAIMLVAFLNLGSALTPTPVPVAGAGLRTSGLYSRIRHPIYTGLLTLAVGVVLRSPGPWPVFWLLVLAVILTTKSVWEERMLSAAYPDYERYRSGTGRFLPRLH